MSNGIKHRTGGLVAAALTAAVVAGCGGGLYQSETGTLAQPAVLQVENNNFHDAKIYLASAGPRVRLGTVTSQGRDQFVIPGAHLRASGVRIEVALLSSNDTKVTEHFVVRPGDHVELTVRNTLSLTSFAVYGR